MAFKCVIVTPERAVLDDTAKQVILPAYDGLMGVLSNRAPMLVKLGIGPLRVDLTTGQSRHFLMEAGVAQMNDNVLTILTEKATPATELDAETARAAYAEAVARRPVDAKATEDREKDKSRARAAESLVGKS